MRETLRFAGIVIVADQAQPFYKNPYIIAGAALVVAIIILVAALLLFRSSGKKKRANAPGTSDWQRQGQQAAPGGWNQQGMGMPAASPWGQQGQQPNTWGAQGSAQQQQAAGWGMQGPAQQQPAGWDMQSPAQQQPAAGWGAQSPAQQQPGGWGSQSPAQQQPAGWGNQSAGGMGGQQPWDAPASPDPWAQQQQGASAWGQQSNQPAPTAYGSGVGSGQSWGQPAPVADQWGQPVQQPAQQGGWSPGYQQPATSTPPGSNTPWQQQGQGFGQAQGQQGFGASPFESPEADRTMLRSTSGVQGVGFVRIEEGKDPGRVYEVHKESLSIGRSRESDIFLEDLAVSRLHASIISLGNNNYALRDEGSANGTKVNGQQVNKYQPYPLQEGDKIQLGQTVLVFAKR
jgi:hypothetical protein